MRFAQIAQVGVIALAATGVYGFVSVARDGEARRACTPLCALRPNYAGRNRIAPDFELPALGGGKRRLSDYRGRAVIMNFWTKTCRPCLEEMPAISRLAKVLATHPDIALITICTDETLDDARNTLRSVLGGDPPFPVLLDPDAEVVTDKYGTKLFPETWYVDPRGVIRARFDGVRDWGGPLPVDLGKSLLGPLDCEIEFSQGAARGPEAALCGDLDHD